MLEQRIRVVSEALARTMNRRTFLRQTGTAVASSVTALALGSILSTSAARASAPKAKGPLVPAISCSPPGPYCNTGGGDLSGCHGAHCYQHLYNGQVETCHVYYQYYQVGCWSTASGGGYWTCCDCQCTSTTCGCAEYTGNPVTLAE
jgi:hypothetical protein